ncbi:MAG: hypothetical protein PHH28_13475 [Desulfuromonadaceae bacterium]|nr:hypothetical protein [Desulfuromonadaceae bacterium]
MKISIEDAAKILTLIYYDEFRCCKGANYSISSGEMCSLFHVDEINEAYLKELSDALKKHYLSISISRKNKESFCCIISLINDMRVVRSMTDTIRGRYCSISKSELASRYKSYNYRLNIPSIF